MYRWTPRSAEDLSDIEDFIADDDPHAAIAWVGRLRQRVASVAEMPNSGRMVPEFGRVDIREVLVRHYRIIYRVEPAEIVVLAVFGAGQQVTLLDPDAD